MELTETDEQLSTNLFAILVGQCQAGEIPTMAMLVPERNGLELWRRMHARFEPENKHKPFAWLRALSNPTFPTKETLWQRGLEEWDGEIAKCERECTKQFDEDLKLAILSEVAPKALAPQIAMNSSNLTSYKLMNEFIVQYLKSKNLWKRNIFWIHGHIVDIIRCAHLWASSHGGWCTGFCGPCSKTKRKVNGTERKSKRRRWKQKRNKR